MRLAIDVEFMDFRVKSLAYLAGVAGKIDREA
jgi:hypothetical protein